MNLTKALSYVCKIIIWKIQFSVFRINNDNWEESNRESFNFQKCPLIEYHYIHAFDILEHLSETDNIACHALAV